jgi:hypothetical protein
LSTEASKKTLCVTRASTARLEERLLVDRETLLVRKERPRARKEGLLGLKKTLSVDSKAL